MNSGQVAFFESGINCIKYIQNKFGYKTGDFDDLLGKGYLQVLKAALLSGDRASFLKYFNALKGLPGTQKSRHKGFSILKTLSGYKPAWDFSVHVARKVRQLRAALT